MKYFRLSLLLLLLSQAAIGQDTLSPRIKESWTKLKTQLQRRTDIAINLSNILSQSKAIDKKELNDVKTYSTDLSQYLDTLLVADSLSLTLLNTKNNRLLGSLSRSLVMLENDPGFRKTDQAQTIMTQLEACENRIHVAKREYNDACREANRPDLYFGADPNPKAPEVKF